MTQSLRRVHRISILLLAFFLPLILTAGLVARHAELESRPVNRRIRSSDDVLLSTATVKGTGGQVRIQLMSAQENSRSAFVYFLTDKPLVEPDVLLYRSSNRPIASLPADATLLGSFSPENAYAPIPSNSNQSFLILYSLAHQKVLAVFPEAPNR